MLRAFDDACDHTPPNQAHREMACHEQAVLAPRVEWLPGLGLNQRPSD